MRRRRALLFAALAAAAAVAAGAATVAPADGQQGPSLQAFGYDRVPQRGPRPLLVILQDYSDTPLSRGHTPAFYRRLLFGRFPGASINGWYAENSHGRLTFTEAGV